MVRCKLCGTAEGIEDIELVGPYCLQCDKIIVDNYYTGCITGAADD